MEKNKTTVSEIISFLGNQKKSKIINPNEAIKKIESITEARKSDMTFCSVLGEKGVKLISNSKASLVICHENLINQIPNIKSNIIYVKNPRLDFIKCTKNFFNDQPIMQGIHPTAIIESKIPKSVYVGPHSFIEKNVKIGEKTIIQNNVHIHKNTTIGKNCIINSNSVIGSDGMGFERGKDNKIEMFPHIGGINIKDDVKIGSNVCVEKGTIQNTIIGKGTKIDNLVLIGHNVKIGNNCSIVANSTLGGSIILGDNVFVGLSVTIRNQIKVGKNAFLGMGSVIVRDVPANVTVIGNPAKIHKK